VPHFQYNANMYQIFKRTSDIVAAVVLLLLLTPVLLPVMFALRLTAEGYIFYFQKRIGYRNKPFDIWKFATMLKDSPNMGTGTITLRNDPRVTSVGHFLRKTKINELPQVINVLLGDMSLVGPRPLDDRAFNSYPEEIRDKVYLVKPGITGIGSVIFRDEEKIISGSGMPPRECYATVIAPYKGTLELWYQQHQSFVTDLKIILLTVWVVLNPESKLPYIWFPDLPKRSF
jgi:lipopolysaccharide/colanic/teichoic acid biosynthesis glycosyltransferase